MISQINGNHSVGKTQKVTQNQPEILEKEKQIVQSMSNMKINKETKKQSLKDYVEEIKESQYPVGSRKQVLEKMTMISPGEQKEFSQCKSYKEIVLFHKKNTPWLGDTQINALVKEYIMQARDKKSKGRLKANDQWMLVQF